MAKKTKRYADGGTTMSAKKEKPATTQAEYDKAFEDVKSGKIPAPSFDDSGPLPKPKPQGYKPKDDSNKKPEPTFKSDVDDIVSGVKKFDDKVIKGIAKAAGKTEKGILNSKLSKDYKKGGSVSSASKRADGCAIKGRTRA